MIGKIGNDKIFRVATKHKLMKVLDQMDLEWLVKYKQQCPFKYHWKYWEDSMTYEKIRKLV